MSTEKFLIDSNFLITSKNSYYAFDLLPSFWDWLSERIDHEDIFILDSVRDEILAGEDRLSEWIKTIEKNKFLKQESQPILEVYAEILEYLQQSNLYQPSAFMEWADVKVADPWLIATSKTHNLTLVTFETGNNGLNSKQPSRYAKIPDVAKEFRVRVASPFDMMRKLGFRL